MEGILQLIPGVMQKEGILFIETEHIGRCSVLFIDSAKNFEQRFALAFTPVEAKSQEQNAFPQSLCLPWKLLI